MTLIIQPGLVSTIIPVFNRPAMVLESINSVMEQTYRPIEVIVVDDGSTDETLEVLRALEKRHAEVRVFTQTNAGPGVARETGRQQAQGEFIQYLDSDDLILPNKFSDQVAGLLKNEDCAVAYGKTESRQVGDVLKHQAMRLTGTHQVAMFPEFLRSRWWGTSTPLYRRSVLDQVGPWLSICNEEDWEYDCRVASVGGKLFWVDDFVSIAQRHDSHLSSDGASQPRKLKDRCVAKEHIYLHAKHYSNSAVTAMTGTALPKLGLEDWEIFSKSVFLLARQCAAAGLVKQAQQMFELSVTVIDKPTIQHTVFKVLVSICGWSGAAKMIRLVGR